MYRYLMPFFLMIVAGAAEHRVDTLQEALALAGLKAGDTVTVAGYYRANDGGGGRFVVTDSAAPPDGGMVFVPDQHISEPKHAVGEFRKGNFAHDFEVPKGAALIPGSVTLSLLNPGSGEAVATFRDREHMHGHAWAAGKPVHPLIDYGAARFEDRLSALHRLKQDRWGLDKPMPVRLAYCHSTGPLRLERRADDGGRPLGDALDIHWFGGRLHDEDPSFDNQPVLCWMINVASARNAAKAGAVKRIRLSRPGVYEYAGPVEVAEGLDLEGAGGVRLADVTNDLGHRYRAVRVADRHTRLRVKDGTLPALIRRVIPEDHPNRLPPDERMAIRARGVAISPQPGVKSLAVRDLVLDGNWKGNQEIFAEDFAPAKVVEGWLRNAPGWCAVNASNHGGKEIPPGQHILVENVATLGYGAAGLLGNVNNTWTVRNVRLADSIWNHVIYNASGFYENLTLAGFGWGHTAWYHGTVKNLVAEDVTDNPFKSAGDLFGIRGGDYFERTEAKRPIGTAIDGFYLDLRGSSLPMPFAGLGSFIEICNGVVVFGKGGHSLFAEAGNGWQRALYQGNRIENVTCYDSGGKRARLIGTWNVTRSYARNVRTETLPGVEPPTVGPVLSISADRRQHPAWDTPQEVVYHGIRESAPSHFICRVDTAEDAAGRTAFLVDCEFDNRTNTVFVAPNGQGKIEFLKRPEKLRLYMADSRFRLWQAHLQNLEIFFTITRFRDCEERNIGRRSEDRGSATASGGEREMIIPTRLFWAPAEERFTRLGGAAALKAASFSWVNGKGQELGADKREPFLKVAFREALKAGERLDWEAAIRPWEEGVRLPAWYPHR